MSQECRGTYTIIPEINNFGCDLKEKTIFILLTELLSGVHPFLSIHPSVCLVSWGLKITIYRLQKRFRM
jgi:hypothetical protein